jgi:hypothetical protein
MTLILFLNSFSNEYNNYSHGYLLTPYTEVYGTDPFVIESLPPKHQGRG